ncbi:MAG: pitrilysin family protein [Candidatus Bipolaricaulota bacterium]
MKEVFPGCFETRLPVGLRVLAAPMENVRSVSMGVWVRAGSRHDPPERGGLAHLIEHMVFKGTKRRSALEIARVIDALGGQLNGSTSKEATFYFTTVLDEGFAEGLSSMADLVTQPKLAPEGLERERAVVLDEIRGAKDTPEEVVFELLAARMWGTDHPLGRPVMGNPEQVKSATHQELVDQFNRTYVAPHSVLVASGRLSPEQVEEEASCIPWNGGPHSPLSSMPPSAGAGLSVNERDIQQVHIALGFPTVSAPNSQRYTVEVMSSLLGGGVSSRLFQRVREERGLLYTVFSSTSYYTDAGALIVYAACDGEHLAQVLELIWEELEHMAAEPPDTLDLDRAVQRLRSGFLLGQEDPSGRLARLGTAASLGLPLLSPDEVVARLQAVSAEQVQEMAQATFRPEQATLALAGPSADHMERTAGSLLGVT